MTASRKTTRSSTGFSALQRAEIAENEVVATGGFPQVVSVLFNEPKLLKASKDDALRLLEEVSVLFNEPKLLKSFSVTTFRRAPRSFSALQRAEIAESRAPVCGFDIFDRFSALQRAEIAEIDRNRTDLPQRAKFQCSSTSRNC